MDATFMKLCMNFQTMNIKKKRGERIRVFVFLRVKRECTSFLFTITVLNKRNLF